MGAQAMQNAMGEMTQNWLLAHPILGWGVAHPLWALGMVIALAFMSGGLLRAIAQLTEQLWIDLLQLPMRAIRWGLDRLLPWGKPQPSVQDSVPVGFYKPTLKQDQTGLQSASHQQLCEIMVRLEQIQQEQALLLQDIKALLLQDQTLAVHKKQIFLNGSSPKK